MKEALIIELKISGKRLEELAKKLNENTQALIRAELKVNLIKAQLVSQASIVNLPNQVMRDAEMEKILQSDEQHAAPYREYLTLKTENKIIFTDWVLQQELNKNIRVMLMSSNGKEELFN